MEIKGLRLCEDTTVAPYGHGDNWHTTWAANGMQYTGLCDGHGFREHPEYKEKDGYNSRIYMIEGPPDDFTFRFMRGYPDLWFFNKSAFPNRAQYFGFGILAVNGTEIYQFMSSPRFYFDCGREGLPAAVHAGVAGS